MKSFRLALRLALREFRGGVRGVSIFLSCLILGIGAITVVSNLSDALHHGIAAQGRQILGGDIAFRLTQREVTAAERDFLASLGTVSGVATLRAMARSVGEEAPALVEIKAVDQRYPLYGTLSVEGQTEANLGQLLAAKSGEWGALVETGLSAQLDLAVGDYVQIGDLRLRVTGIVADEPDRLATSGLLAPRLLVSREALDASGLLRPGSLVRWYYRVRLDDCRNRGQGACPERAANPEMIAALRSRAEREFPDAGWRIRDAGDAAPGLTGAIDRLAQILNLVALTALIVGGVGIANAVRTHLAGKEKRIATLKAIGLTRRDILLTYGIQICVVALVGSLIGVGTGTVIAAIIVQMLGEQLPLAASLSPDFGALILAVIFGLVVTFCFSYPPLDRASRLRAALLFRDHVVAADGTVTGKARLILILAILLLVALTMIFTGAVRLSLLYVAGTAAGFVGLALLAQGMKWLSQRLPRPPVAELRLAFANIARPNALTSAVILTLGIGLTLLISLAQVDGNIRRQLTDAVPADAPSFFFLDIARDQTDRFTQHVMELSPNAQLEMVPMLRGRITHLNGTVADSKHVPADVRWVLEGDRGITYADAKPERAELVEGSWWPPAYTGPALVSFDAEVAAQLGLKIGDMVTVNILGRPIDAKIHNLRKIEWENLSINFVMVFSANSFVGAPHMMLATLASSQPTGDEVAADRAAARDYERRLTRAINKAFPEVTIIWVETALATAHAALNQIMWAVRAAASTTLAASLLVLGGALAASQRERYRDVVILKVLGAPRNRLMRAFIIEFLLISVPAALFAACVGTIFAWVITTQIMDIAFSMRIMPVLVTILITILVALCLALAGTWRVFNIKSWAVLRSH